jgi:dTDP-4-dehydrorhamnose reductase
MVNGSHMLHYKKKIVFTGGTGRFGQVLKKTIRSSKINIFFPTSKTLNILKEESIRKYLKLKKPTYLIHAAGLSRPMDMHDKNISKSINLNIIGTSNITKVCSELNIKLIFFSTAYVYPGENGNYKEDSPIKPINNYGLSKMGGEAAVQMYKNSLILRLSMTENPFIHKNAFTDFITNFIYHDDIAKILIKILDKKGILNIGGKSQSVYNFVKSKNINVKKISAKTILGKNAKLNVGMNLNKLKKLLND